MAMITLSDVRGIADPLDTSAFEFSIPNFPGGDGRHLAIKCLECTLPGFGTAKKELEIHGYKLRYAGNKDFGGSITATFVETRAGTVYRDLMIWSELVKTTRTGGGVSKDIYATIGKLDLMDNSNNNSLSFIIEGMFPEKVEDLSLGSADIMKVSVTFSYDILAPEIIGAI